MPTLPLLPLPPVPPTPAFLIINGNTYGVTDDGTIQMNPVTIGEMTRAFSGMGRSTIKLVKREWTLNTTYLSETVYQQFLVDQASANGIPVINGDIVSNVPTSAVVLITNDVPIYDGGARQHILTLNIREV